MSRCMRFRGVCKYDRLYWRIEYVGDLCRMCEEWRVCVFGFVSVFAGFVSRLWKTSQRVTLRTVSRPVAGNAHVLGASLSVVQVKDLADRIRVGGKISNELALCVRGERLHVGRGQVIATVADDVFVGNPQVSAQYGGGDGASGAFLALEALADRRLAIGDGDGVLWPAESAVFASIVLVTPVVALHLADGIGVWRIREWCHQAVSNRGRWCGWKHSDLLALVWLRCVNRWLPQWQKRNGGEQGRQPLCGVSCGEYLLS